MKHFNAKLIFALLVFSINVSLLNAQRHFYLNLSKQCLSAESALTKIQQKFEIDPNCHFKLINDTTDRLGMQHLTYKQYLYDFEIVGCMVLVHVKKGSVQSMNGIIMEQDLLPFERPSQTRSSLEILGEKVYIPIEKAGKTTTKLAIKQLDNKSQSEIYIDASTGDTLRTISMRNFLDGNSNTKIDYVNYFPYKDSEEMEVLECKLVDNNYYSLQDTYRNFLHSPSGIYPSDLGLQDGTTFAVYINIDSLKKSFNITEEVAWWYYSLKFTLSPLSNPDSILYSAYLDEPRIDYWWGEISFESEEAISLKKLKHIDRFLIKIQFDAIESDSSKRLSVTDTWEIPLKYMETSLYYTPQTNESQSKNNIFLSLSGTQRNPSCEIFWGMQKSYDYFYEQFGIRGYDNNNSRIRSYYDEYGSDSYSGITNINGIDVAEMSFGNTELPEKEGIVTIPQVSLDIVAHEYSHLVVSSINHRGLKSHGETGALCESFADIFASAIMNRYKENEYISDYLIGEEVALNAKCLRSLAADCNGIDGTLQPQCYHGKNWDAYYNDFGTNSGVQNRWFYLLCNSEEKVSGTNDFGYEYEINPITLNKGEQIVFRNLNFYLTPFANYHDAAMGSLQATADLYGINSDEFNSVLKAWCAVGICLDDRIADIADGMPTINPNLPLVYAKNGEICVKANPNSIVKIFTPIGMLIEQRTTKNDLETFTIPNLKIAIVMVNNDSFKIIIP